MSPSPRRLRTTAASPCPQRRTHHRPAPPRPAHPPRRPGRPTRRPARPPAPAGPQPGPRGPRGDGRSGPFTPPPARAALSARSCLSSPRYRRPVRPPRRTGRRPSAAACRYCLATPRPDPLCRRNGPQRPAAGRPANHTSRVSRSSGTETGHRHPPHPMPLCARHEVTLAITCIWPANLHLRQMKFRKVLTQSPSHDIGSHKLPCVFIRSRGVCGSARCRTRLRCDAVVSRLNSPAASRPNWS
jgi:hypothetical protein